MGGDDDDDTGTVVSRKKVRTQSSSDDSRAGNKRRKEARLLQTCGSSTLQGEGELAPVVQPHKQTDEDQHSKAKFVEIDPSHHHAAESFINKPSQRSPNKQRDTVARDSGARPGKASDRESILRHRQELPMYQAQKEIVWTLNRYDTLVLVGETGSGKTTQVGLCFFMPILLQPAC